MKRKAFLSGLNEKEKAIYAVKWSNERPNGHEKLSFFQPWSSLLFLVSNIVFFFASSEGRESFSTFDNFNYRKVLIVEKSFWNILKKELRKKKIIIYKEFDGFASSKKSTIIIKEETWKQVELILAFKFYVKNMLMFAHCERVGKQLHNDHRTVPASAL